jgi:hypothetical protein
MKARKAHGSSEIREIGRRWWRFLLILLPTVGIALAFGIAAGDWRIPGLLLPLLLAPLAVAILLRKARVTRSPWELVYEGPLVNGRMVREALLKEGIQVSDPSDQDMGSPHGSGGWQVSRVYVQRAKAEQAVLVVHRLASEHTELFRQPSGEV